MTGPLGTTSVSWSSLRKTAEDATRPLPVDWYDVVVVKAEYKVASTGSNMVAVTLEVENGPHATRRVFTNFVLTPDNGFALGIFFTNLGAFGLDDAFFESIQQYPLETGIGMIAQALQDRSARVKVGIKQWQGQDRNECQQFTPRSSGGPIAPGVNVGSPIASAGPTSPTGPRMPSSVPMTPSATPMTPSAPPKPAF